VLILVGGRYEIGKGTSKTMSYLGCPLRRGELSQLTRNHLSPSMLLKPAVPTTDNSFEFLFRRDIEFRQETIYFIVVDRFCDGDPENNAGPNAELYDPATKDWGKYWGGDLQGIIDKLDYLQGMGVTALWLTPLFEQVERLVYQKYAAIHGYWTRDFKRINPRYIAKEENYALFEADHKETTFDRLIAEMHRRGMKLILDIVCNHSSPEAGGTKGQLYDNGRLIADFNNDTAHWYHHYGEVKDWNDDWQVQNCELAGLATFNENNSAYRNYIKGAIKLWLDRGVDALRVDTVKHMPQWFWQEFMADILAHRPDVFVFGEWIYSHPADGKSPEFTNHAGMSILDFGFAMAIRRAVGKNEEGGFQLVQGVLDLDPHYDGANELVTFLDNHDMHRFQTLNPDPQALRIAVVLLLTSRGIPCIYYGTEQELHDDTNAGDRLAHGNNDPYNRPMMAKWDPEAPIYRTLNVLTQLRRLNPAISLGGHWPQKVSPEVYAYTRRYRDSRCFVAMNKGAGAVTIDAMPTLLPDRTYTCFLTRRQFEVKDSQIVGLELASKEAIVLSHIGPAVRATTIVRAQINGVVTKPGEIVVVTGNCPELGNWDVFRAPALEYINANTWFGEIPFNESVGHPIVYKYAIRLIEKNLLVAQPTRENIVCRRWVVAMDGIVKWRDHWNRL
jgi:cyclomaltodextrin glucanotransferase